MEEKQFLGAPFGIQSARFDVSGVHPRRKLIGTFTEIQHSKRFTGDLVRSLGPGRYEVDTGDLRWRGGASGQGWSKPHGANGRARMTSRQPKEALGPGRYKLQSFTAVLEMKPCSVRGVCASREERFREHSKKCPAGPGSYGKGGIPSGLLDERRSRPTGSCPTMDFSAGVKRFPVEQVDCGLCPGTYKLKSFTELILQHRVGKKGPYQIFTSHRDKPINYGYFAAPRTADDPGTFFLPPMFGDDFKKPQKRTHGRFGQVERFPSTPSERIYHCTLAQRPEPANQPGPGHYSITRSPQGAHSHGPTPPPFLSSTRRFSQSFARQMQASSCIVGPGRYNVGPKVSRSHKKGSSAFKSHTKRYLEDTDQDRFGLEKLRPINIPAGQRANHRCPEEAITHTSAA